MNYNLKFGLMCFLFGILLIMLPSILDLPPDKERLGSLEGNIEWAGDHPIKFKFYENPLFFMIGPHASGEAVQIIKSSAGNKISLIRILYNEKHPHSPFGDDNHYHSIYELSKDGTVIDSYEQIANMARFYNKCVHLIGLVFLGISLVYWKKGKAKKDQATMPLSTS